MGREHALDAVERLSCGDAAVLVRERRPVDLRGERPHAGLVRVHLRRHRHRRASCGRGTPPRMRSPPGRPVARRAILTAFSTASAPELKNAARVGPAIGASGRPSRSASSTYDAVRDDREVGVDEPRRLLLDRLDDAWVAVADVEHADAAREVDERVAVDVGDRRVQRLGGEDREVDLERLCERQPRPAREAPASGARESRCGSRSSSSRPRRQRTGAPGDRLSRRGSRRSRPRPARPVRPLVRRGASAPASPHPSRWRSRRRRATGRRRCGWCC